MGDFASSSQNSSGASQPTAPAWMSKLTRASGRDWSQYLPQAFSSFQNLVNAGPEGTAQLTPAETGNINSLESIANNGGLTSEEQQSQKMIDQLTGGAIGSSPATAAAMRAYNATAAPVVAQNASMTGGRGGALEEALTNAQEQAYVPLIQQEIGNRENAIGQEQTLGQDQTTNIQNAMNASDMQRQVEQERYANQYQNQQTLLDLMQKMAFGPASGFGPSMIGNTSSSSGSATPSLLNILFGV